MAEIMTTDVRALLDRQPFDHSAVADLSTRAVCDADRVPATMVVRAVEPGERFRPLGRGGSKLLHDAGIATAGAGWGLFDATLDVGGVLGDAELGLAGDELVGRDEGVGP